MKCINKLFAVFILSFCFQETCTAQGGTWTWVHGAAGRSVAKYGTKGVAAPTNTPGSLADAVCWTDKQGNFWLFGGKDSYSVYSSDLWRYDRITNMWTWVHGPGIGNLPGQYGSMGVPSQSNYPAGRYTALSWTDNDGDLWLYGGNAQGTIMNDLWKYNITTDQWVWMKGSSSYVNNGNVYGTMGIPDAANTPGDRQYVTSSWVAANGDLWLFGGEAGFISYRAYGDMWRYNIASNCWTWMSGPMGSQTSIKGVYGTMGIGAPVNQPPARNWSVHWQDEEGYFYLFGGLSSAGGTAHAFTDVWRFDPYSTVWTWIAGDSSINSKGNYPSFCTDNGLTPLSGV